MILTIYYMQSREFGRFSEKTYVFIIRDPREFNSIC